MTLRHDFTYIAGIISAIFLFSGLDTATASILKDQKNLAWASQRDLTSQQFSNSFNSYRQRGYIMIDIDAYPVGNRVRYAMIWRRNTDGRGWAENRDLSSAGYKNKWDEYRAKGYRPHDIETYLAGNNRRWAGIWVENKEGLRWSSNRGLTGQEYGALFQRKNRDGFRLVDIEVYSTSNGLRYACIWLENKPRVAWSQLRNMTRSKYQDEVNKRSANGFRVVDFESYTTSNGQRYAAIWERKPGYKWQTRTNRTARQFANLWRQYRDEGYRLVDFERYQTARGARYAGVWAENDARYRYNRKGQINTAVQNYRNTNALPGISVAVIRNGQMIYRRGFGQADVANNKVAHGETVYAAASVSKVIGGTLAAKLEDEERLRDGTTFTLDLTRLTSAYLSNIPVGSGQTASIPSAHTHTVEQMLAHLGCIPHYPSSTTPGISDQSTHYATASAAVRNIWNTGLVTQTSNNTSCTVGNTRSYSTPAFTFIGAVLERRTGRSIARLVKEEIADRYGFSTMRAMFTTSSLPSNYDRAVPYTSRDTIHTANTTDWADPPNNQSNPNQPTSWSNNSWKVLGGGIEVSTVDLARFGWRTLNGDIVAADARDNRMWTPVRAGRTNGLAWELRNIGGRRVAEHGGSWSGARTQLRVYRDDGLVIAIMSNRRNHRSDQNQDVDDLATQIGNIVLN
jgi:CubicO group peptidase (beta-lactamase class C family)